MDRDFRKLLSEITALSAFMIFMIVVCAAME